jgi:acetoin utilization protein AcuA
VREFALEVARGWRGLGLAGALTRAALADPAAESELLLAFLLPTAWDTEHEGLTGAAYRTRLADLLHRYGFRATGTDEPEVRFQQNAALLVRQGARATEAVLTAFENARYQDRPTRVPLMPAA